MVLKNNGLGGIDNMSVEKGFKRVTFELMDKLLGVSDLEEALSGSLEIIARDLGSEAGAVWLLDKENDILTPAFHMGPADISNVTVRKGQGAEGYVIETGESLLVSDATWDPRFDGTAFDKKGFTTRSLICVPVKNADEGEIIGCFLLINRINGTRYGEEELEICEQAAALSAKTIGEKGCYVVPEEKKQVLVSLKGVTKDIENGGKVSSILNGVNLDIYKNEFVVLLGEPGSGNTAVMNIAGGMDTPTEGTMSFEDMDYSNPTDEWLTQFRRDFASLIFKSGNLMPNLTVLENVQFIAKLAEDSISPWDALDKTGLEELAGNYPSSLTGSQQLCAAVAKAIVKKPQIILADDPTALLSYDESIEFLSVIQSVVSDRKTTLVMTTQNAEIAKMADRVVRFKGGKVLSIKKNLHPLSAEELVW